MSKFELENLKENYLYNNTRECVGLCFTNNELSITEVLDAFCNSIPYERPDGYCVYNNILYLFEHFCIDSSKNEQGSSFMKKFNHRKNLLTKSENTILNYEESLEYYIENFKHIVYKHYNKISKYKEEVTNELGYKGIDIKVVFVCENPSPLGVRLIEDSSILDFHPLMYKNFLYSFLNYSELDYFLLFNHGVSKDYVSGLDMRFIKENYDLALKVNKKSKIDSTYLEIINNLNTKVD